MNNKCCKCCECHCKKEKPMKVYINDREITFSSITFNRDFQFSNPKGRFHVEIYLDEKNKLEFTTNEYKVDSENNKYWFYVIWL